MVTPQRRPKPAITPPTLAAPIATTAPMQAAQTGAAIGCAAHAVVQVPRIIQATATSTPKTAVRQVASSPHP